MSVSYTQLGAIEIGATYIGAIEMGRAAQLPGRTKRLGHQESRFKYPGATSGQRSGSGMSAYGTIEPGWYFPAEHGYDRPGASTEPTTPYSGPAPVHTWGPYRPPAGPPGGPGHGTPRSAGGGLRPQPPSGIKQRLVSTKKAEWACHVRLRHCEERLQKLAGDYQRLQSRYQGLDASHRRARALITRLNRDIGRLQNDAIRYQQEIARLRTILSRQHRAARAHAARYH